MFEYRKINVEEKEELKQLAKKVLDGLKRKEFFTPFTDKEIDKIFADNSIISYGAYDKNKLVGTAQLYFEDEFIEKIKEILGLEKYKVAELGDALVLEEYRNNGIMKRLSKIIIQEAKNKQYDYITITVHPENIASNRAFSYTGAKIVKTINLGKYLRNIYLLDLKEI